MLVWSCLGIFIVAFIAAIISNKEVIVGFGVAFSIISAIVLIVCFIVTCCMIADTADMEAFYNSSVSAYRTTVTDTSAILSMDDSTNDKMLVEGSIEKMGVGTATAEVIKDLRNNVVLYNNKLAFYNIIKKNIWISILYPEIPAGLKYLSVK